jgi:phosphoserine phosphatase
MLDSWNDGPAKAALLQFLDRVTTQGPDFVPPSERVAVFDNDGTLWVEQPMYTQAAFLVDRVNELAREHPEWAGQQPFKGVLDGDLRSVVAAGEHGALALVAATHTGMTADQFTRVVTTWLARARHPRLRKPYLELVYQPMLELLDLVRRRGFTPFIVSGGGVEFIRPWAEAVYGIPPHHVIGSRVKLRYEPNADGPALVRLPAIDLVDDRAGKPVGIHQAIGRRPLLAVGNSDGDYEMLEWTTSAPGPRLGMLIHHTDAAREFAYDRDAHAGRLARALDDAPGRGWVVIDMKRDWKTVFAT